jgi:hypothetical protein
MHFDFDFDSKFFFPGMQFKHTNARGAKKRGNESMHKRFFNAIFHRDRRFYTFKSTPIAWPLKIQHLNEQCLQIGAEFTAKHD